MEKEVIIKYTVKGCWHNCPYFSSGMDGMWCGHPYWKNKKAYENMIITHNNSRDGKFPEKCPLIKIKEEMYE